MSSSNRFFEGLAVGGILGFIIGLLYAPKSGAQLRRDIVDGSDEIYRQASTRMSDLKDRTDLALQDLQSKSDVIIKQAASQVQETRDQLTAKLQDIKGGNKDKVSARDEYNS